MDFSEGQKLKKMHFDTKFHIFWSTWESNILKTCFQIIIKFSEINASQIYVQLKDISGSENFLSKIVRVHKIVKKTHMECFFQLMLNISSIKELLHKFLGVHPLSYYPLKSRKHKKLLFFCCVLGAWEPMWNFMLFMIL